MRWRKGAWVGRPGRPPEYQLTEQVREGGEGEVWQAVSTVDGVPKRWALKILLPERIAPHRNPREVFREWERRWEETLKRTHSLSLPGIVFPSFVFPGPPPFDGAQPDPAAGRMLYMVSRWVEGGQDLHSWRRGETTPAAWCEVLEQICVLVERLADAGMVHGDLSPANIMLENGDVRLIDFTWMKHAGAPPVPRPVTPGYTAPGVRLGESPVDPRMDRYSVGAVAYFLLTGGHPGGDPARAALRLPHGFTESLGEHVAALLNPDPRCRPPRLVPWVEDFRRLVGDGPRRGDGHKDLALAVDGAQTTEIVAAGELRIAVARASSRHHPMLHPLAAPAPSAVRALALARRGNGDLVMFARDAVGTLALRVDGEWRTEANLRGEGSVRAAGHGDGRVSGFVVDGDGRLVRVTVRLDGQVECERLAGHARRVLAVASGPGGEVFLAVEDPAGCLRCGPPKQLRSANLSDVDSVALCINANDEPVCVAAQPGSTELIEITHPGDDYLAIRRVIPGKPSIRDVASLWLRTGLLLAIATDSGLWIRPERGPWTPLWPEPVSRVVLGMGHGWRVQLAALAEGRVLFAKEQAAGRWPEHADCLELALV